MTSDSLNDPKARETRKTRLLYLNWTFTCKEVQSELLFEISRVVVVDDDCLGCYTYNFGQTLGIF